MRVERSLYRFRCDVEEEPALAVQLRYHVDRPGTAQDEPGEQRLVHGPCHEDRAPRLAERQERSEVPSRAAIDEEDRFTGTPQRSCQPLRFVERIDGKMRFVGTTVVRNIQGERTRAERSRKLRWRPTPLLVTRRREGNHAFIQVGEPPLQVRCPGLFVGHARALPPRSDHRRGKYTRSAAGTRHAVLTHTPAERSGSADRR